MFLKKVRKKCFKGLTRMMVDVNMALMAKTQDLAEIQGQEIQNMIEAAAPSFHALDVYA